MKDEKQPKTIISIEGVKYWLNRPPGQVAYYDGERLTAVAPNGIEAGYTGEVIDSGNSAVSVLIDPMYPLFLE